jgi:hypothetical protein
MRRILRNSAATLLMLPTALSTIVLTGCVIVSATAPPIGSSEPGVPEQPVAKSDVPMRYKPYARELDKVLRQQATVEKELEKRDWPELADELGDWRGYIRRLNGVADTSHDPVLLRQCCDDLMTQVSAMSAAQREHDAAGVHAALDAATPVLDRLSGTFPLIEVEPEPPTAAPTSQPAQEVEL